MLAEQVLSKLSKLKELLVSAEKELETLNKLSNTNEYYKNEYHTLSSELEEYTSIYQNQTKANNKNQILKGILYFISTWFLSISFFQVLTPARIQAPFFIIFLDLFLLILFWLCIPIKSNSFITENKLTRMLSKFDRMWPLYYKLGLYCICFLIAIYVGFKLTYFNSTNYELLPYYNSEKTFKKFLGVIFAILTVFVLVILRNKYISKGNSIIKNALNNIQYLQQQLQISLENWKIAENNYNSFDRSNISNLREQISTHIEGWYPPDYCNVYVVDRLSSYFRNYRATTIEKALDIFFQERQHEEILEQHDINNTYNKLINQSINRGTETISSAINSNTQAINRNTQAVNHNTQQVTTAINNNTRKVTTAINVNTASAHKNSQRVENTIRNSAQKVTDAVNANTHEVYEAKKAIYKK